MDVQEKKFTEQDMSNFMSMMMMQQGVNWRMEMQTEINTLKEKAEQLTALLESGEPQAQNVVEMVSIKEASQRSGVSYDFIRKMCINNQIAHVKAGSKYLVNWKMFINYLNGGGC